jgi:sulfur relay (sulfurtransferase) complex TusBCD TusD component (DsrE family)
MIGEQNLSANVTVIINRHGMGEADAELSHKLVSSFLNMLDLGEKIPGHICLYADGVKLAVSGSPVLEELGSLVEKGAQLLVCTTCLNHFGLLDQLQVGTAGGMKEIVDAQWNADKVITI